MRIDTLFGSAVLMFHFELYSSIKRQAYLERALDWVSSGTIDNYMSMHRNDKNITKQAEWDREYGRHFSNNIQR